MFYNKSKVAKKQRVNPASHCLCVFLLSMSSSSRLLEASEQREVFWVRSSRNDELSNLYSELHQHKALAHILLPRKPHHKAYFVRSGSCNSYCIGLGIVPPSLCAWLAHSAFFFLTYFTHWDFWKKTTIDSHTIRGRKLYLYTYRKINKSSHIIDDHKVFHYPSSSLIKRYH